MQKFKSKLFYFSFCNKIPLNQNISLVRRCCGEEENTQNLDMHSTRKEAEVGWGLSIRKSGNKTVKESHAHKII
jgi:hypothetical protein